VEGATAIFADTPEGIAMEQRLSAAESEHPRASRICGRLEFGVETAAIEEIREAAPKFAHGGSLLCGAQNVLNGLSDALVTCQFGFELGAALRGEAIETNFAIGLRDSPLGGDPTFDKHLLERGIEEAFFDGKHFAGEDVDALGDRVAVKGARLKDSEDQHGEGARRHPLFRPKGHRHNDLMPSPESQGFKVLM